jgi:hypothetical protein
VQDLFIVSFFSPVIDTKCQVEADTYHGNGNGKENIGQRFIGMLGCHQDMQAYQ